MEKTLEELVNKLAKKEMKKIFYEVANELMIEVTKKVLKEVVDTLILEGKTVATMESCTGGGLAHYITNIPGASSAFRLGIATYSNEAKINVGGVPRETIDKYTVYSMKTANDMARMVVTHLGDNYGVGITGQLKRVDPSNPYGSSDEVHISVYDATLDKYYNRSIVVTDDNREDNKMQVICEASLMLLEAIKFSKDIDMVFANNSDNQQGVTSNNTHNTRVRKQ